MLQATFAVQYPFEGSVSNEVTLTFPAHTHHVTLINDDVDYSLSFKFSVQDDFATLKAGEILELGITTDTVILFGGVNDVEYRVWGSS